jgi:glucose-6-phosphate isomerase
MLLMGSQWDRYRQYCFVAPELGFTLDISRVQFGNSYLATMRPAISSAIDAMESLEAGSIANPDEGRMVGHYWLREPGLAPSAGIAHDIRGAVSAVSEFARDIRCGAIGGAEGSFRHFVHVGIGGSALGPQFLLKSQAAGDDRIIFHFLDNADPDSVGMLVRRLYPELGRTLVSVVSKSGWTPTPCRVMAELEHAYAARGLGFSRHAVAITMAGTALGTRAAAEGWLARFPVWEWVGGRTSVTSAVGLLPAAVQGTGIAEFLRGAADMDRLTRLRDYRANPAAMLALMWYWLGNGRGDRRMVVLPYRDRLALLPRYLQQLVMESVGKRLGRLGDLVEQGFTVYGHKGVTDQHAYAQQLLEGTDDAFVTFIDVETDQCTPADGVFGPSLGDHLFANLEGTRDALTSRGRDSIAISLRDTGPMSLGALIAFLERAVGLYAELIDVNAYHQPSVNKDAAAAVLALQAAVLGCLRQAGGPATAPDIAAAIGQPTRAETVYKVLRRLASSRAQAVTMTAAPEPFGEFFGWCQPESPPGSATNPASSAARRS